MERKKKKREGKCNRANKTHRCNEATMQNTRGPNDQSSGTTTSSIFYYITHVTHTHYTPPVTVSFQNHSHYLTVTIVKSHNPSKK